MQIQCHIVLYLPDYHVNTHRVCSTFWQLCEGWEIEVLKLSLAHQLNRSTKVEFRTSPQLLQNCSLAAVIVYSFVKYFFSLVEVLVEANNSLFISSFSSGVHM
jgi:hypothetical protein